MKQKKGIISMKDEKEVEQGKENDA